MASFLVAVVTIALVAVVTMLRERVRRAAARREEVLWLRSVAAREAEIAKREAYYYYGYGHQAPFVHAYDVAAASLWTTPHWTVPGVASPQIEMAAPVPPVLASPGKGMCAVCCRPTSLRCKECKAVKYCTYKCQIVHWRQGHKDGCHPASVGARQDNTIEACLKKAVECDSSHGEKLVAGVESTVRTNTSVTSVPEYSEENCLATILNDENKEVPFKKASDTAEVSEDDHENDRIRFSRVTGHTECADCKFQGASGSDNNPQNIVSNSTSQPNWSAGLGSGLEQSSEQASSTDNLGSSISLTSTSVFDKVSSIGDGPCLAACNPSKKADNLSEISVESESEDLVPNNQLAAKKIIRQQTGPKPVRRYPPELTLFPYEHFVQLYNFDKMDLRPFGLCNIGNSCYANAVLQCLTFTRPLTAYLLQGLHSRNCSKKEWCFLCEFEEIVAEGKRGKSPVSPNGILSHLCDIGSSFGSGEEEDAHEFLRYVIDNMQSARMKEAKKNGAHELAEETRLVQLIFGGYLRSKIKCTKCQVSSEHCERILDLTVEIDGDISTLQEALRRFTSREVLDGDNRYHCSRCKSYERAKKKLTIWEAPNILTIALKRYQSGKFGKINKAIRFPEYLNLSSYMSSRDDCSPVYRLYAVVVHEGVMNSAFSGHYVCYVNDSQGKWHKMDDSQVKPVSLEKVQSRCAYMLLYARCSPRAPSFLRKASIAQASSRRKKARQTVDPGSTCMEGASYLSRHQGGQLSKGHIVYGQTCALDTVGHTSYPVTESPSPRDSPSPFSNSDSGSTGTSSSESTDSTSRSTSMEEYDYIFGSSDQMYPVSTVVIPEEHELSFLRQMSSLNPSSSSQNADQIGEVERLHHPSYHASRGIWDEIIHKESSSFFYTDRGKHHSSSSSSRRSREIVVVS